MFRIIFKVKNTILTDQKILEINSEIKRHGSFNICNVVKTSNEYYQEIETENLGYESIALDILEDSEWFIKNVILWETNDNGMISNMIEIEKESGLQFLYA